MGKLEFQVGKKYKFADGRARSCGCDITGVGGVFECSVVDQSGNCWTTDAEHNGTKLDDGEGWCIASASMLQYGQVIEVTE